MAGLRARADALLDWLELATTELVLHEPSVVGWLHQTQALRATLDGDADREVELLEAAVERFEEAGDVRNACANRGNLSVCLTQYGAFDAAERHLRKQLEAAERMGVHGIALEAKQNLGTMLGRAGRLAEGFELEKQAVDGFHEVGDAVMEAASRAYLAMMYRTQGALEDAFREAAAAAGAVHAIPPLYAAGLGILATIQLERGHREEALEAATAAMQQLAAAGSITEGEALIRLAYAEALDATGQHAAAVEAITVARDLLMARAGRINNPAWRRSFLEKIRENSRTLARAGEWVR
jgi:tetratricopeptide (TPR) repeat protein